METKIIGLDDVIIGKFKPLSTKELNKLNQEFSELKQQGKEAELEERLH